MSTGKDGFYLYFNLYQIKFFIFLYQIKFFVLLQSPTNNNNVSSSTPTIQKYLPTYRLDPTLPYNREKCENIIRTTLTTSLSTFVYEPIEAENLSKGLSEEILAKVKNLKFDR